MCCIAINCVICTLRNKQQHNKNTEKTTRLAILHWVLTAGSLAGNYKHRHNCSCSCSCSGSGSGDCGDCGDCGDGGGN